jgi:hypothetical protein
VQAGVEIHVRVRPQPRADFLAGDDRALPLGEHDEQSRRLRWQALDVALTIQSPQLAAAAVELERPESELLSHAMPSLLRVCR